MDNRRIIDEKLELRIKPGKSYKEDITFNDLCKTLGAFPTDRVLGFTYRETKGVGFNEDHTYYYPALIVIRRRSETDEEYLIRQREEEQRNKETFEREKLEYLRLKAKFENLF
jgi:hypothetical protein